MVKPTLKRLSVKRQCELLELPRSTYYYKPGSTSVFRTGMLHLASDRLAVRGDVIECFS